MIVKLIAILAAALFCGAATYITFVEHPARLELGTDLAVREFAPSYRRASIMQASLAAIGLFAGILAWVASNALAWLVGALLLGSVIPFTLLVIFPTNKRLLDPGLIANSPEAAALLHRWGLLHGVRTIVSLAALFVFLVSALSGR
jgi:hypothetical protein